MGQLDVSPQIKLEAEIIALNRQSEGCVRTEVVDSRIVSVVHTNSTADKKGDSVNSLWEADETWLLLELNADSARRDVLTHPNAYGSDWMERLRIYISSETLCNRSDGAGYEDDAAPSDAECGTILYALPPFSSLAKVFISRARVEAEACNAAAVRLVLRVAGHISRKRVVL